MMDHITDVRLELCPNGCVEISEFSPESGYRNHFVTDYWADDEKENAALYEIDICVHISEQPDGFVDLELRRYHVPIAGIGENACVEIECELSRQQATWLRDFLTLLLTAPAA